MLKLVNRIALGIVTLVLFTDSNARADETAPSADHSYIRLAVTMDSGADRGQNLGSLFEIVDPKGYVVAGAGFCGSYNTHPRSDREMLQVFVRNPETANTWQIERLPAIDSPVRGFYPFSLNGQLYLTNRSGPDSRIFRWNSTNQNWDVDIQVRQFAQRISGKTLVHEGTRLRFDDRVLLDFSETEWRIGEIYYAHNRLFLRRLRNVGDVRSSELVVYTWEAADPASTPELQSDLTVALTIPNEFFYAFGQWRTHVVAVTNNGR
ncbi:MAG: hypothetical protein FJ267_09380, partial [Planctomycetes bacterium]|nr:hypothetical protein [Planctomycetota bacterium]